jgi:hypothetical protein
MLAVAILGINAKLNDTRNRLRDLVEKIDEHPPASYGGTAS